MSCPRSRLALCTFALVAASQVSAGAGIGVYLLTTSAGPPPWTFFSRPAEALGGPELRHLQRCCSVLDHCVAGMPAAASRAGLILDPDTLGRLRPFPQSAARKRSVPSGRTWPSRPPGTEERLRGREPALGRGLLLLDPAHRGFRGGSGDGRLLDCAGDLARSQPRRFSTRPRRRHTRPASGRHRRLLVSLPFGRTDRLRGHLLGVTSPGRQLLQLHRRLDFVLRDAPERVQDRGSQVGI